MKSIMRTICLILYYSIGNKFPHKLGGKYFRKILIKGIVSDCGKNANIHPSVYFGNGSKLILGDNIIVTPNAKIILGSTVTIGNDVQTGPDLLIITNNHNFDDATRPFREQGLSGKPVTIGDDVWIGARVTILPGVKIGKGAVIGAGSVVAKDIDSYGVAVGNPAKVIRYRGEKK